MPNLVQFDETEAIILLSVCQFVVNCRLAKNAMLICLSNILRNYASKKGIVIDDSYRSTSGLCYQTNVMFGYMSNGAANVCRVPKIFVVAMGQYTSNVDEYETKLWEGLIMSSENSKQAFLRFLISKKLQPISDIFWSLEKAEEYLRSQGALNGSMYDELSVDRVEYFESAIMNDNNFVKKYRGMAYSLKIGFSLMKEYVVADAVHVHEKSAVRFDFKQGMDDLILTQNQSETSQVPEKYNLANCQTKTETLENTHVDTTSVPVSFSYYNRTVEGIESWSNLYTKFMKILWIEKGRQLSVYMGRSFVNEPVIDIGDLSISKCMTKPNRIADNVFIETNFTYSGILKRIKAVLEKTAIPVKRFSLTYTQLQSGTGSSIPDNNFIDWLIDVIGLTERTANNYHRIVVRAERLAKDEKLSSQRIITAENYNEANATYKELLGNEKFQRLNISSHNGFTASINRYLEYLLLGGAKSQENTVQLTTMNPIKPKYDTDLTKRCLTLMRELYTNGVKKDSGIARKKFMSAYKERFDIVFPPDIDFDDLLAQNALEYDGKFYATSTELTDFIREKLQHFPPRVDMLFFYDTLYDRYISQLSEYGVYSAAMLKAVLEKEFPEYYYKSKYFATRRDLTLEQMVNAAYGDDICLTLDELQERMPYIERGQILPVLSRSNSGFVRVEDSTYAMESRVYIAQSDVEKSRKIIEDDLRTHGYSVITQIIVEESDGENPEIPEQALQLVLFDLHLANEFSRNRTLIAPSGKAVSIMDMLIGYCKQHRRLTLEDVEEYERELTGEGTARRSMSAVCDAMIRVSEDTFVDTVKFDVKAVDEAIEPFLYNRKVISLKNVTSFSVFPDVEGLAWNSYLLASYLRRYSERWGFIGEDHKKKSIGVIFDKVLTFGSYDDAMAQAVASSGIELTQEDVSYFLMHNEYRLRKGNFTDIISKAYQIRMREE